MTDSSWNVGGHLSFSGEAVNNPSGSSISMQPSWPCSAVTEQIVSRRAVVDRAIEFDNRATVV